MISVFMVHELTLNRHYMQSCFVSNAKTECLVLELGVKYFYLFYYLNYFHSLHASIQALLQPVCHCSGLYLNRPFSHTSHSVPESRLTCVLSAGPLLVAPSWHTLHCAEAMPALLVQKGPHQTDKPSVSSSRSVLSPGCHIHNKHICSHKYIQHPAHEHQPQPTIAKYVWFNWDLVN